MISIVGHVEDTIEHWSRNYLFRLKIVTKKAEITHNKSVMYKRDEDIWKFWQFLVIDARYHSRYCRVSEYLTDLAPTSFA